MGDVCGDTIYQACPECWALVAADSVAIEGRIRFLVGMPLLDLELCITFACDCGAQWVPPTEPIEQSCKRIPAENNGEGDELER